MSQISLKVLDKLRTFDTPTICNIIELFDVRPRNTGYMDRSIRACFPEMKPMVGFAATASFRASARPKQGDAYGSLAQQVERFAELSGPPLIVFQDLDNPTVGATFGELLCTTYKVFGAVGLITSGAGRDLDQVRDIGFPIFTNSTISAHGYCHILHIHLPVHVGGVNISPDTLLHGDLNGVTTIPQDIAAELADIGDEYIAAEAVILEALAGENPSLKSFQEAQAEAYECMDQLRAQVSRRPGEK